MNQHIIELSFALLVTSLITTFYVIITFSVVGNLQKTSYKPPEPVREFTGCTTYGYQGISKVTKDGYMLFDITLEPFEGATRICLSDK